MNAAIPALASPRAPASAPGLAAADGGAPWAFGLAAALLVALQFGPFLGLLGYLATQDARWALVGLARDLLAAWLLLAALPFVWRRGRRLPASARWAVVMALAYALLGLLSEASGSALALNLRRLLLVPLLYAAMLMLPWNGVQITRLLRLLLASSVAVAVFGVLERLGPEALWTDWLQVVEFAAANPLDPFGALPFHESGRFFSWDLEAWAGGPVRRAVSTYLEPTTLAAAMAAALLLVLARQAWRPNAAASSAQVPMLLFIACGVLTLSKSFWLFLPLLAAWRFWGWPSPRQVASLTLAAIVLALLADAVGRLEGPLAHIAGLASAVHHLADGHWLGEGIGAAGNYAGAEVDIGAESGLGNVLGQVGIVGLLTLLWARSVAVDVLQRAAALRDPGGRWLAAWLLFWMPAFLFSASSLGVGGNALGFMMLALYLHPAFPRPLQRA